MAEVHSSEEYFKSYNSLNVHELMIKDRPRTEAYRDFLEKNAHLIKDKVVLDVGAGTGILSLFAAQSGAKQVYAVEASGVANLCKEIIKTNNYEHVITVFNDMVENVELPVKVDIIVSEWMGFYLLHESMLESVLYARDKWLKDDGIILPSHAVIYTCPVNMHGFCKDNFEYWENVYGFDFSPFQERTVAAHLNQPTVILLKEEQLLSETEVLTKFDLKAMNLTDIQDVEEKLAFKIHKDSVLHGFAAWFDVVFSPELNLDLIRGNEHGNNGPLDGVTVPEHNGVKETTYQSVTLSTSPSAPPTHWKQTVCFLPMTIKVEADETIYCKVSLAQDHSNKRHYNITLEMLESLDDTDEDYDEDDDDFEEDTSRHPVPCDCGSGRCQIISAIVEKYDEEQTGLEMEAEFADVSAEVQAAQTMDKDFDADALTNSTTSLKDDS